MSGVVPMNMSESSYAIDSAWSLLQSDDKLEKFLPLIPLAVGGAFGALGAYTGAGGRFINPETGKFDPGMHAKPKYQDPLTGGFIAEREVGDTRFSTGNTTQDRFLGGAVGALQGLNPFAATGAVVRGTRGAVGLSRAQRAERAAERAKAAREASEAAAAKARQSTDRLVGPQRRDELYSLAEDARMTSGKLGSRASKLDDIANQPTMYQNYGKYGRMAQLAGNVEEQLGPKAAALAGATAMSQMPQAPTTGFGAQSQMGTAGAAPTQGTPVSGNKDPYALREIYNPKAGSAFEGQKEFGGLGVQKGDNMFRKNIGEELLSEVAYRLHKAHCGTELKADCPKGCKGCPKCDGDNKKKADDKKKPAHGMVIVIGSKAGPGPSTDGKRDKLDSEKKKE